MRILAVLFVLAFGACGGAQRPAGDPSVIHVQDALTELGGGRIWRVAFDVSKTWTLEEHHPTNRLGFINAERDATMVLMFDAFAQDQPAGVVAEGYVRQLLEDFGAPPPPLSPEIEEAMKKGKEREASYRYDLGDMTFQCRVHGVATDGRSVWMIVIGIGPTATWLDIAHDMERITFTAKLEPIDW